MTLAELNTNITSIALNVQADDLIESKRLGCNKNDQKNVNENF